MPRNTARLDAFRERKDFWRPIGKAALSFSTHRLVEQGDRLELRASTASLSFWGFFLGLGVLLGGLGAGIALGLVPVVGGSQRLVGSLTLLALGAAFGAGGWIPLREVCEPFVFDRRSGRLWRGRAEPAATPREASLRAALTDVAALQLLEKEARKRSGRFLAVELNLVLVGGERISLLDHGGRATLEAQASTLAGFLGVPLMERHGACAEDAPSPP